MGAFTAVCAARRRRWLCNDGTSTTYIVNFRVKTVNEASVDAPSASTLYASDALTLTAHVVETHLSSKLRNQLHRRATGPVLQRPLCLYEKKRTAGTLNVSTRL